MQNINGKLEKYDAKHVAKHFAKHVAKHVAKHAKTKKTVSVLLPKMGTKKFANISPCYISIMLKLF